MDANIVAFLNTCMIKLYSGPLSWFSRKVEIALREKGLPFMQVLVPFSQSRGYFDRPSDVTRINPKRQVPVMINGEVELYDSTVIIEYLDEAYPRAPLLPREPVARARCRMWDVFADEVMLQPIRKLMHRTEPHDHTSVHWRELEHQAETALPTIAEHFDRLEVALREKDYLCTDFSAADISSFMAVFWSCRLAGPDFGERTGLQQWYNRLSSREAFAAVTAEINAQDQLLSAKVKSDWPRG